MHVSPQGLLVAGDEPQLNPNDKGLIAAVLPHAVGARVVARGFYEPWAFATGQNILTTAAAGLPSPGVGTNAASTQTVRLYPTASGTSTVWEKPVKAVSVLLVFVKYGASGGTTPMFGNTAPNTAPYEAWALDDASGNLTFSYSAGGTYRSVTGGGGSIQVGRVNVALGTYDGATARLFLNGLLLSSTSQTGDLVYPTAADRGPGLGNFWNFTSNNRSLVGRIFLGALWETGLPADRAIEITKSPQAAFEAVLGSRGIWVPLPASAGGSVSLIVADATHGHTADGLALTSSTALSVAEATHAHAADNITLVVGSVLAIAEASHAHTADSLTLTAASALAVADAAHSHAADNITLSVAGATSLTVADALHSHAADALALTSAHALIVADATHGHTVDGLTLTAASVLAIQEALHAHAADNVTLDASGAVNLLLADGLHAHTADGVALTVAAWLTVADALHGHAADNVVLTFGGVAVEPLARYTITAAPRLTTITAAARRLEINR